jgi:hypothetical protein
MYNKINIMVPTYKRPGMLGTLIDSARSTSSPDNICFTIMRNIDDHSCYNFIHLDRPDICLMTEETCDPNLSHYYNEMYRNTKWQEPETLVSMIGDDMVFETPGWDSKILGKANEIDGIGIIYCNDGYISQGEIAVNLFTSRKFVDAAGSTFMVPEFKRYWFDTIWTEIANATDTNYYMPDIMIKHNHTSAKPHPDETFVRLENVGVSEMTGGAIAYKDKIWPYVTRAVKNLQRSGLC